MCGEPFDEESDVVVCPECGAPHHRDCWKETGHCACEEKHAEGYEWHPEKMYIGDVKFPPDSEKEPLASGDDETERCPNCGKMTKKSEKYCEYCGYYKYVEPDSFSATHNYCQTALFWISRVSPDKPDLFYIANGYSCCKFLWLPHSSGHLSPGPREHDYNLSQDWHCHKRQ